MELAEKLDGYGKAGWITVLVLGFVLFWPLGLVILGYIIGSGRMGCWNFRGPGRWYFDGAEERRSQRRRRRRRRHTAPETGNRAFDEYREETLRRLEDEQAEFGEFLENLRHAKDKAEFDQFMAGRRERRPNGNGGREAPDNGEPSPAV